MVVDSTPYDDAAYAVELALERTVGHDRGGVARHATGAVRLVSGAPYPGLVREAVWFGSDAVVAARAGEFERSRDFLTLLRHVIEEMSGLALVASSP